MTETARQIFPTDRLSVCEDVRQGIAAEERALAKLWPDSPIHVDAYDLRDINAPETAELLSCVLELSIQKGKTLLVLLNVDDLLPKDPDHPCVDGFKPLKDALRDLCLALGMLPPLLKLRRTAGGLDMHVGLRQHDAGKGNVISLDIERRRRYLADNG